MAKEKKTEEFATERKINRYKISDLAKKGQFIYNERAYLGFRRCDILKMSEHPERYGLHILRLSDFMYLRSGYYKRLIDYFANQAILRFTVDTRVYSDIGDIKGNFLKFSRDAHKLNLDREIHNILRRMYRHDVVYAYIVETELGNSYFYLSPFICGISGISAGGVFTFYIDINRLTPDIAKTLPVAIINDINAKRHVDETTGRYYVPADKSLCLKYNNDLPYPYPPFFTMIADILLVDDFKDLAKAQSINDAYKLLTMKIPTKDGNITLDEGLITAFTTLALEAVQNNIGVVTTPFDMKTEEFSSSNSDDRDTVSDSISWAFKNAGVSEALMSGASTGSELKLSITNDSGDIFRIYRMIEQQADLWLRLKGHTYNGYEFRYTVLDLTTFNENDKIKSELSAAQSGLPDKFRLCAMYGSSPLQTLGNGKIENEIFADFFNGFKPLSTSYTQSASSDTGGRPEKEDGDISEITERQRDNDSNSTDNRI